MGLKKGQQINRKSALRDAIFETLTSSKQALSVTELREFLVEKPFLFQDQTAQAIKRNIQCSLVHLIEKKLVGSKTDKSKFFKNKTAVYYFIN